MTWACFLRFTFEYLNRIIFCLSLLAYTVLYVYSDKWKSVSWVFWRIFLFDRMAQLRTSLLAKANANEYNVFLCWTKVLHLLGQMLTLFLHSVLDGFTLTYLSHIFQIHVCFLAPLEITRGHLSRIAWFYFQNVENNIWKMKWHVTKMGWVDISKPWHCFVLSFQMKADFHAFFLYCISE